MFETTHWSLVIAAGGASDAGQKALAELCATYWYPLYGYVRRRGMSPDDARDLTQGFFASILERRDIEHFQQAKGRFRAFLIVSMQHFMANEVVRRRAQKRGGNAVVLSLEFADAEGRYVREPAAHETPQSLYERRWALTAIDRVLVRLRADWDSAGRGAEFDLLKGTLLGEGTEEGYAAAARQLGSTEGALRVAAHRLRRKFKKCLREEVASTVSDPSAVDDELRHLIRALTT